MKEGGRKFIYSLLLISTLLPAGCREDLKLKSVTGQVNIFGKEILLINPHYNHFSLKILETNTDLPLIQGMTIEKVDNQIVYINHQKLEMYKKN